MIPYTYLIICKPTQQSYYGVRYSKNCHPDDLWQTYFTSSSKIKRLIKLYGKENFCYEVRKIFSTKESALRWEKIVISRLKKNGSKNWLNTAVGQNVIQGSGCSNSVFGRRWYNNGVIDKYFYPEMQPTGWKPGRLRGILKGEKNGFFGKTHTKESMKNKFTEEVRQKISLRFKGKPLSSEHRANLSKALKGRVPWNKGKKFKK